MYIVLIGPPGSGKGTYSKMIEDNFNFYHFDTGKILRESNDLAINKLIDNGNLVSQNIILNLLNKFSDIFKKKNIILDGLPRDINQAMILNNFLKNLSKKIDLIIELKADEKVLIDRLLNRRVCKNCNEVCNFFSDVCKKCSLKSDTIKREDDKIDVINGRMKIYNENLISLKNFYKDFENYKQLDTSSNLEEVYDLLKTLIKEAS